jgi:hypothetical protein
MHENSLFGAKFFISNSGSGYFHGSEASAFLHLQKQKSSSLRFSE